jgi:ribosome biogenesis GTPase
MRMAVLARAASVPDTGTPLIMIESNFEVLRSIGFNQFTASQLHTLEPAAEGARLLRLSEVQRDWFTVHDGIAEFKARALPGLIANCSLAVGDWVIVELHGQNELWISQRLSPASHIARRTNEGHRQSIASNIDTALLVMGLDHDFNLRRMERYIAMVQAAGIAPVIVLTKADIGADIEQRIENMRKRLPSHIPIMSVNALNIDSISVLEPWLNAGQTLCLLGTSGTGKSTLTNTLCSSGQETGGNRKGDGRGRHTTTSRSLHLCPGGACIIDTPGLRTWRPDADEEALAAVFTDIEALAADCQFRNCRHELEPGCAVREHVDADRLLNYHKLLRDANRIQQTPLDRIAERAKWKVLMKAGTARSRDKRN